MDDGAEHRKHVQAAREELRAIAIAVALSACGTSAVKPAPPPGTAEAASAVETPDYDGEVTYIEGVLDSTTARRRAAAFREARAYCGGPFTVTSEVSRSKMTVLSFPSKVHYRDIRFRCGVALEPAL